MAIPSAENERGEMALALVKVKLMLTTNVIKRQYRVTLRKYTGAVHMEIIRAESPAAARLLCPVPSGWEITEVTAA